MVPQYNIYVAASVSNCTILIVKGLKQDNAKIQGTQKLALSFVNLGV